MAYTYKQDGKTNWDCEKIGLLLYWSNSRQAIICAFLNMFSSRKCLLTFAYHYSMTLLTFHSVKIRSWPPAVNFFFYPITNTILNNPFQRKSCTRTCNLTVGQDKGTVTELREEKSHASQALKLSRRCSKRSKDMAKQK